MKESYDILIVVLGWEERYILGIEDDFKNFIFNKVVMLNFNIKTEETTKNRDKTIKICEVNSVQLQEIDLDYFNSIGSWNKISEELSIGENGKKNLINISTIPRETIWIIVHLFKIKASKLDFVYHKPKCYSKDWVTKEPGEPRLLLKHSGIQKLNYPTALIIISGFDIERAKQLIYFFEPKLTLLGIQKGSQFDNLTRNQESHKILQDISNVIEFETDAYTNDFGYKTLISQIIIVTSLGPRSTAVAIYKAFLAHPEIALAYVPNKIFNSNCTEGIGDKIMGTILD